LSLFHIDGGREWSATERQALVLAREIKKQGFASRFVVQPESPLHKSAAAENLSVLPLSMPGGRSFLSALRLASALRRERCVLVHFHDAAGQAVGAPAAARANVPVRILSRRTDVAGRAGAVRMKDLDAVIVGSEGLKDVLVRRGLPASAVEVMASGGEEVKPNPAHRAIYDQAYKLYVALYGSLKDLYPECAAVSRMAR
jgi:hypothetical protein